MNKKKFIIFVNEYFFLEIKMNSLSGLMSSEKTFDNILKST